MSKLHQTKNLYCLVVPHLHFLELSPAEGILPGMQASKAGGHSAVWLLDEADAALDEANQRLVASLLRQLVESGSPAQVHPLPAICLIGIMLVFRIEQLILGQLPVQTCNPCTAMMPQPGMPQVSAMHLAAYHISRAVLHANNTQICTSIGIFTVLMHDPDLQDHDNRANDLMSNSP